MQGGDYEKDDAKISQLKDKEAHYIIGGNTDPKELTNQEVVTAYKEQNKAERGFRFLKDPLFFGLPTLDGTSKKG